MNKRIIMCVLLLSFLILSACSTDEKMNDAYIIAFETMIEEDVHLIDEVESISLFINDESVTEKDFTYIKKHFTEKYNKQLFSYSPEELTNVGPYGKEDMSKDGLFLYIRSVELDQEEVILTGEKFNTITTEGSLGMEIIADYHNEDWHVNHVEENWRN